MNTENSGLQLPKRVGKIYDDVYVFAFIRMTLLSLAVHAL
jgi:hypothetical protein